MDTNLEDFEGPLDKEQAIPYIDSQDTPCQGPTPRRQQHPRGLWSSLIANTGPPEAKQWG